MNWKECMQRMRSVFKKDGTAIDSEYFMATHVPFKNLEFQDFGDTDPKHKSVQLTEEEIYDKYIVNRANRHQMIIVRGTNGTGKSHLICWLHNRFVNDKENYNPDAEKVIFLRRLGNTVRGAIQQILDVGLVQDDELREKFEKFCNADKSQSEEEFKTSIYSDYVNKVATDSSDNVYRKILRKDIAAFLYDKRVQEYMMRSGGPADRCYQLITAGAQNIVTEKTEEIFTNQDFDFPRELEDEIKKNAAQEVQGYYLYGLRKKKAAIEKLVSYLNHFTSSVMQSCANISSENARDLFVNLRKSLHREGRNLTIFIEDFTSFSIMESELITALAVENGGEYSDLCRVNSIIGITDGYYKSFKDNFKDRVTLQIEVTEQSFSDNNFLLELAARYLNAIYSTNAQVTEWYKENSGIGALPDPAYTPAMEWDYVELNGKKYTLYPLNKKSLTILYNGLSKKSPRNYIWKVISPLFAQFANDTKYKNSQKFPEIDDDFIKYDKLEPPYANSIERTDLSDNDKRRLKILFQVWGNGKTDVINGKIGGIPADFLNTIGLGNFKGTGSADIDGANKNQAQKPLYSDKPAEDMRHGGNKPQQTSDDNSFQQRKEDIESWFDNKKVLESPDFNTWVANFVFQSIDWQSEGVPGEFAIKRRNNGYFVYIEDSKQNTQSRAVVILKRTPESETILLGLNLFNYYQKSWNFNNASYYQLVMINWLEHNKQSIIRKIFGESIGTKEHPAITWCIAAEYIERLLTGEDLDELNNEKFLQRIFGDFRPNQIYRTNKDWNNVLTYLHYHEAMQQTVHDSLIHGSNTLMCVVGDTSSGNVKFFRTTELFNSIEHLKKAGWDISGELENPTVKFFDNIRAYLQVLYTKVLAVTDREKSLSEETIKKFEELIGANPTEQDYIKAVNEISNFYKTCSAAHELYSSELKMRFDEPAAKQAKTAISLYQTLKKAVQSNDSMELLLIFSKAPREKLDEINSALTNIEEFAKKLQATHSKLLGNIREIDPLILNGVLTKIDQLSNTISRMEAEE